MNLRRDGDCGCASPESRSVVAAGLPVSPDDDGFTERYYPQKSKASRRLKSRITAVYGLCAVL
jgi:hypothetical protein